MNHTDFASDFPRTQAVIAQGIERGLHTGCQLYVSLRGNVLADVGVGESHPGVSMTADTINLWLSAGKPLTAVAVMQQCERGALSLDDRVARFIPEFAVGGKSEITIRHLLTHTGGFRTVETGYPEVSWDETIRRISAAPLEENWIVGHTAGYHTTTSWFILGELLQRVTDRPYAEVMRDELFHPLGLNDTWAALPIEQYAAYGARIGWLYAREQGELKLLDWSNASRCAAPSPGSNSRGPIRELGRFYEMLLNEGEVAVNLSSRDREGVMTGEILRPLSDGRGSIPHSLKGSRGRVLMPQTVAAMTARQRVGEFDQTLGHVVDFGLGVIIDSNQYGTDTVPYGYGRYCSSRTFGHGGAQSSQGWCDPEAGLVVAYYFNGRPGEGQHHRRAKGLNEAIYLDLGLAEST